MKTAVITGAGGFLGGALSRKLLSMGIKVYGIDVRKEALGEFASIGDFVPVAGSFDDADGLKGIIGNDSVDVFYHFAWAGGFTDAIRDYKLQMLNAGKAGDAVMTAYAIGAKKFVYANTYNQYEIMNFLSSETFEPRFTCIYSTGKTAASLICRTLAFNLGMEYSAGLIPMPYGERNYSKQLVNVVIHHLTEGNSPKLVEGNNLYDLVYIDDIAEAFAAIGERGKHMKEYYVGHRKLRTFREWITEMRDCLAPEVELKFGEYKDHQQIDYSKVDLDALFRDTGWECRAELKDHIGATAEWVQNNLTW